ncbi:hypothetical protein TNCV_997441 [Trichonephila clavipes]|nr:hypothetical protein TNCV_997441 [Trichonephila clavipes]
MWEDPAIFASAQLILLYLRDGCSCSIPSVQTCSIGERSGDLAGHDDRVSQEIAPHTVTPCEIAVCRSTINAGSGPLAGAPPNTCAVVIIAETESVFITEDDTSPVCHTPSCPRSAKIQSTLPMMWGQW